MGGHGARGTVGDTARVAHNRGADLVSDSSTAAGIDDPEGEKHRRDARKRFEHHEPAQRAVFPVDLLFDSMVDPALGHAAAGEPAVCALEAAGGTGSSSQL